MAKTSTPHITAIEVQTLSYTKLQYLLKITLKELKGLVAGSKCLIKDFV